MLLVELGLYDQIQVENECCSDIERYLFSQRRKENACLKTRIVCFLFDWSGKLGAVNQEP